MCLRVTKVLILHAIVNYVWYNSYCYVLTCFHVPLCHWICVINIHTTLCVRRAHNLSTKIKRASLQRTGWNDWMKLGIQFFSIFLWRVWFFWEIGIVFFWMVRELDWETRDYIGWRLVGADNYLVGNLANHERQQFDCFGADMCTSHWRNFSKFIGSPAPCRVTSGFCTKGRRRQGESNSPVSNCFVVERICCVDLVELRRNGEVCAWCWGGGLVRKQTQC